MSNETNTDDAHTASLREELAKADQDWQVAIAFKLAAQDQAKKLHDELTAAHATIAELKGALELEQLLRRSESQAKRERGDIIAELEPYTARLEWLHSGSEKDADGCEWGVYRVKWDSNGKVVEAWHTLTDYSDLDAAMAGTVSPQTANSLATKTKSK